MQQDELPAPEGLLNDPDYVERQYEDESKLAARASVWVDDENHPFRFALDAIRRERPSRVLDVGCGTGAGAELIAAETGAAVVAADSSPRMVELAAARRLEALVADVQALPFGDGEFDCVVAAWMLYHVPDVDRAIAELARVLGRDGLLVAITNGDGHLAELWRLVGRTQIRTAFSRANGAEQLGRHFDEVEQHDLTARALFPDRTAAARYISSVYDAEELLPRLPPVIEPFEAHGEPTVFLARRASRLAE